MQQWRLSVLNAGSLAGAEETETEEAEETETEEAEETETEEATETDSNGEWGVNPVESAWGLNSFFGAIQGKPASSTAVTTVPGGMEEVGGEEAQEEQVEDHEADEAVTAEEDARVLAVRSAAASASECEKRRAQVEAQAALADAAAVKAQIAAREAEHDADNAWTAAAQLQEHGDVQPPTAGLFGFEAERRRKAAEDKADEAEAARSRAMEAKEAVRRQEMLAAETAEDLIYAEASSWGHGELLSARP